MKKIASLFVGVTALLGAALLPPSSTKALTKSIDVINFKPAVDTSPYLQLYGAENRPKGEWNIGFYLDYAKNPLELAAPLGNRRVGVVDDTLVFNLIGSYSFTDWFTAGVRVPIVFYNNYLGLSNTSGIAQLLAEKDFSMGDVALVLKFRLLDSEYVDLALVPYVNFPSGKSSTFMGSGNVTGGGKLAVDFQPHDRVKIGLNVGATVKPDVTIRGTRIDDQIDLGLAVNIKAHEKVDLIAEAVANPVIHDLFDYEPENPVELNGAVRIHATKNLDITAGGGAGLTLGVGTPDFRAFLGVNYTRHVGEEVVEDVPCQEIKIEQMVHFDFDKSVIKPQSYAILDDVASILQREKGIQLVSIEGHTDAIGTDAYNQKLSERRANAVRTYLVSKGIDPSRLESVGYGESRPIATNATAEGRSKNRRTEFKIVRGGCTPKKK